MNKLKIIEPLKGFKYLYGQELAIIKKVQMFCESTLRRQGFEEIITPFLVDYGLIVGDENRPLSVSKAGLVFDFQSAGKEHIALRYENTFPVCKFYVENLADAPKKVRKLFYISPQFRNEVVTDINSRLRQFYQVGWEVIGGNKKTYVVDSIKIGADILKKLKIKHHTKISEVNVIAEIFESLKLARDQRHELLAIIDERSFAKLETFFATSKLNDAQKALITKIMTSSGAPGCVFTDIKPLLVETGNSRTIKRLNLLTKIYWDLQKLGCKNIRIDLSIVRSNKFYSGIVFQYYVGNIDHECGGGGEYNRVVKSLGGPDTISSGAAFGFERIMYEYLNSLKHG